LLEKLQRWKNIERRGNIGCIPDSDVFPSRPIKRLTQYREFLQGPTAMHRITRIHTPTGAVGVQSGKYMRPRFD
jgi:hypothetical protein